MPETSDPGLQAQDDEGKALDSTLAKLQYAVDSYNRTYDTQVADDDSKEAQARLLPRLTNLEMLVQRRVIRAIPAAPNGKKYILNPDTQKVEMK